MNLFLILNLASRLFLTPSVSIAENSVWKPRPNVSCSTLLNSSAALHSESPFKSTIPRPAAIYIKLLEQTLTEIGALNAIDLNEDRYALQLHILQLVATSSTPIDPLEELAGDSAVDSSAASFFNRSHLLKLLMANKAFRKAISNVSVDDWNHIQEFAKIEKSAKQAQVQNQNEAQQHSKQDFVEVAPDSQGRVRLHYLIEQRNFADAIALLNHPTTTTRYVNTRDRANETPLDIFFRIYPESKDAFLHDSTPLPSHLNEQPEIQSLLKALKWRNALTSYQIEEEQIALIELILHDMAKPEDVEWNYQLGADLNFARSGDPALVTAARKGNIDVVIELLRLGASVNSTSRTDPFFPKGKSAIFRAAENGHSEIVKLLASSGADLSSSYGAVSLVDVAVINCHAKIFRVLAELGLSLHSPAMPIPSQIFRLNIPEHVNAEDTEEIFQVFRDFEVDLSYSTPNHGTTPAHLAVKIQNPRNLRALAKYGANLDKKDHSGKLPLRYTLDQNPDPTDSDYYPIYQKFLEIFYNYYTEKGIPPAERDLAKIFIDGKIIYQYLGIPKIEEGISGGKK